MKELTDGNPSVLLSKLFSLQELCLDFLIWCCVKRAHLDAHAATEIITEVRETTFIINTGDLSIFVLDGFFVYCLRGAFTDADPT